jgi:tetrahydromethanopterin S-methyltransferase subunit B
MKKNNFLVLGMLVFTFLLGVNVRAQEDPKPVYITVTTMYRNLDTDRTDWQKTEQEYYDKVTSKNDLIIGSEVLTHYYTANSSEVLFVSVYKTWEDIEKSEEISNDLIKKGWPDEKERKAFFDKQRSYYMTKHSDEIYTSQPMVGEKQLKTDSKEPMIVYIRKSQLSMKGQGKGLKEFNEKVTFKNPYIKAYYPHRHAWGSDSREFIEAFLFDSMSDMDKSSDKDDELIKAAWPKEADRKAFFDEMRKAFTGLHGDYIYHNEPKMSK